MNKLLLFLFPFIFTNQVFTQNLAPNPSFENYSICPNNMGQIDRAIPWYHEELNVSNGDYYNRCNGDFSGVIQNYQTPRTGDGMTGLVFFTHPNATYEYREYIKVKLNKTLEPNINYCVTYYVSLLGLSWRATDALCACFSEDSLLCNDPNIMLLPCSNYTFNTVGNIIKDTLGWTKVTMSYTAHGGEQFLTLGNFKTSVQSNSEIVAPDIGWYSYYFIDDVAVFECDAPVYPAYVPDQSPCKGETVTLGSQTRPQYLYEWKDAAGNVISDQGSITIVADTSTYYVLKQKDFKFDETTDTCFITIDPFCLHIPNVITPNNDGINDFLVIDGSSELTVDLQLFNRWGKLVYHSKHYQNNWPVNDIADGVYFYTIKATSATGEIREYQGSVSVIH